MAHSWVVTKERSLRLPSKRENLFIMIEKVLYFLEEVVCKTVSDFFFELPQTSLDYGLRNKISLMPYMAS